MRGGWVVPTATAVAAFLGSLFAVMAQQATSRAVYYSPNLGPYAPGLQLELVAVLFGVPAAALVAAVVSYAGTVLQRPRWGGLIGAALGAATGAAVGASATGIAAWWLNSLPANSDQTSAVLAALLTAPVVAALDLSIAAALMDATTPRRTRIATLLAVGAFAGFFLGAYAGGIGDLLTFINQTCNNASCPYTGFTPWPAQADGTLLGAWIGAVTGLGTGAVVTAVRSAP